MLIGGEGYIGKVVRSSLINNGYVVTPYDYLLYQNRVYNNNAIDDRFSFIHGDIIDTEKLKKEIDKSYAVVLLAGLVGDPITKKCPKESALINDTSVENVIDICAPAFR
jgi:nucleoside-diphosphate-sugar epimerase